MQNIEMKSQLYKNKNKKMTINNFEHLENIESPEAISNFLVGEVYKENFPKVREHIIKTFEKSSNPDVILAMNSVIAQIDNIVWLWKPQKTSEITRASADDYGNMMAA